MIKKERMVKYLINETRYTRQQLENLNEKTLQKWYKEEKEINKNE